ncbi:CHAP domain-containing protein [Deinococcus multiflagellatus]|uniref:CHAP domain-containing protein n=1 Tax=Deinococcus multiflagellatus TaxID=1656887 RepID=A0ABW1ZMQ9_9DEIO|nr:CHAP domain-containing protein [Deinococcus multiflagellatus]MBZ9714062.1 CHAP domain-containing protein [Deinococcus multiflagellatus]
MFSPEQRLSNDGGKPAPKPQQPAAPMALKKAPKKWERTFVGKGKDVKFQLRIIRDEGGRLIGRYMATPGSGAGWHVEGVIREDNTFVLKGTDNNAEFAGQFSPDGKKITTSFNNKTSNGEFKVESMQMGFVVMPPRVAPKPTQQNSEPNTQGPGVSGQGGQQNDSNIMSWEETISQEMRNKLPALAEPGFLKELQGLCTRLGIPRDLLLAVMAFESADAQHGTRGLDPTADNGLGYYGLIQFGAAAARDLGIVDPKKFATMSATQQLPYVEIFLKQHGVLKAVEKAKLEKRNITLEEIYMSILAGSSSAAYRPVWKTRSASPDGYDNNSGLDSNNDKQITPTEAADAVRLHWRDVFGNNIDSRSRNIERVWYNELNPRNGKLERKWKVKEHDTVFSEKLNPTFGPITQNPTQNNSQPSTTGAATFKLPSAARKREIVQQQDWGAEIGSLDGVAAYYNDGRKDANEQAEGNRNYSKDGKNYEYGLKWQCVEYVRRYYYDVLDVKFVPRSGDAQDYFDKSTPDGSTNPARSLRQFKSGGREKPKYQDLIIFGPNKYSGYGHVAIVAAVTENKITIAQQNVGTLFKQDIDLETFTSGGVKRYRLGKDFADLNLFGWLRK